LVLTESQPPYGPVKAIRSAADSLDNFLAPTTPRQPGA